MQTARPAQTLLAVMASLLLTASATAISPNALHEYQNGVALEQTHDYKGAEAAYRKAIALNAYDSLSYLKLADLVSRDDRKDEALQLYQQALTLNPKDSMIRLSIAQILEVKGQSDKALEQLQLLHADNPDYAYVYLTMARLEKTLNQPIQAINDYQQFLAVYPKHFDAQRELATLQLKDKQYEKASKTYGTLKAAQPNKFKDDLAYAVSLNQSDQSQKALDVLNGIKTPSATLYEQKGISDEKLNKLSDAYVNYQEAFKLDPQANPQLHLRMADIASSLGKPDDAMTQLKAYLETDPKNAKIQKSLADLDIQQKNYPDAISLYQDAIKNAPANDSAFKNDAIFKLGYAQQMNGNLDAAIGNYQAVLATDNNDQARLNLALAYHQQGQYEKALDLYRQLIISQPQSTSLRHDMGQVLLALGDQAFEKKDYQTAANQYQDAYLIGPDSQDRALVGIANTQFALKNDGLAYSSYQRVLAHDPQNLTARLNKAQLDMVQKNWLLALDGLRNVLAQQPENITAQKLLGQTYAAIGDYGNAILTDQKVLSEDPKDVEVLEAYGNAWRQVGDLNRAQKAYELARTEAPDNALIHYNLASVYNLQNKLPESIAEYHATLIHNPAYVDAYYGLGTTLEKQKQYPEAIKAYQQYVEKASASSNYVAIAKQRITLLAKPSPTAVAKTPSNKTTASKTTLTKITTKGEPVGAAAPVKTSVKPIASTKTTAKSAPLVGEKKPSVHAPQ